MMFCGLPVTGGGAADVGSHGEREQIGQGVAPQAEGELGDERRQHQADGVVDEKGGEAARDEDDAGEQPQRMAGAARDPAIGEREEAGKAQIAR